MLRQDMSEHEPLSWLDMAGLTSRGLIDDVLHLAHDGWLGPEKHSAVTDGRLSCCLLYSSRVHPARRAPRFDLPDRQSGTIRIVDLDRMASNFPTVLLWRSPPIRGFVSHQRSRFTVGLVLTECAAVLSDSTQQLGRVHPDTGTRLLTLHSRRDESTASVGRRQLIGSDSSDMKGEGGVGDAVFTSNYCQIGLRC